MQNTSLAVETAHAPGQAAEKKTAGDYEISYTIEPAQGFYEFGSGKLEWKEPGESNVHLGVIVEEAEGGRFIPGLHVIATLIDSRGGQAASAHLPFVWHPQQYRYGANVRVPSGGAFVLQVHVYPATFSRADKEHGQRFVADAQIAFESVRIEL